MMLMHQKRGFLLQKCDKEKKRKVKKIYNNSNNTRARSRKKNRRIWMKSVSNGKMLCENYRPSICRITE